jgi:hypothetical protein
VSAPRAVLVPGVPALLPAYADEVDPVAELRAACLRAVGDLVCGRPERVLVVCSDVRPDNLARGATVPTGLQVARHLLNAAGFTGQVVHEAPADVVLLVGNGSACRSEKAPGHLDPRAFGLDEALDRVIREGAAPPQDDVLAEELWCFDLPVLGRLHELVDGPGEVRYAGDPYGVAYWVATWPQLKEAPR